MSQNTFNPGDYFFFEEFGDGSGYGRGYGVCLSHDKAFLVISETQGISLRKVDTIPNSATLYVETMWDYESPRIPVEIDDIFIAVRMMDK